ncbi:hypothetical protein BOTBODRAFT_170236 [Botryobasidium botryosum FD-172 SS1]|uniref:CFEM domain-containing protein n=1 Tax=Botryobasidium botryosum (strain FD-172 SS1) TaxID=930990 RepID=A0A067MX97_BOTB1|nr:hypothetical protein BOTBODRAFT_170236 [Botryobasidium botryosum FD-172 SS1]
MRFATFSVLAFVAGVVSAQAGLVPACVNRCTTACPNITDLTCVCQQSFINAATPCVQASCSAADAQTTLMLLQSVCPGGVSPFSAASSFDSLTGPRSVSAVTINTNAPGSTTPGAGSSTASTSASSTAIVIPNTTVAPGSPTTVTAGATSTTNAPSGSATHNGASAAAPGGALGAVLLGALALL